MLAETTLDFFYRPFVAFIANPWLALIPAMALATLGLFALQSKSPARWLIWAAAGFWSAYAVYELSFSLRGIVEAIRIDLLIFAPLLWLATLAALGWQATIWMKASQ